MKQLKLIIPYLLPLLFFIFISRIIYMANNKINSIFFDLVVYIPYGDKIGHFALYGVLAMLLNLALNCRTFIYKKISFQLGGFIVFSFALIEEFSQYFFPNRTLDFKDLVADIIGILIFNYISINLKNIYTEISEKNS